VIRTEKLSNFKGGKGVGEGADREWGAHQKKKKTKGVHWLLNRSLLKGRGLVAYGRLIPHGSTGELQGGRGDFPKSTLLLLLREERGLKEHGGGLRKGGIESDAV